MSAGLDNTTVFKISAMLFMTMSVVTWLVLGRPRRGSSLVWCAGGMLAGMSMGLIGLRGHIPEPRRRAEDESIVLAQFRG